MLTYGAKVWGLNADNHIIEQNHLFAIKRLLNVSIKIPNALVYGQSGRYPQYVKTCTKCIKYLLQILSMPGSRLLVVITRTTGYHMSALHCTVMDLAMFEKTEGWVM